MPVVDRIDEVAAQGCVDLLEIDDHACLAVHRAAHSDLDDVVVPVVGGAGAEDLAVALIGPLRAAQSVCGRKRGPTLDTNVLLHQHPFTNNAYRLRQLPADPFGCWLPISARTRQRRARRSRGRPDPARGWAPRRPRCAAWACPPSPG